MHLGHLFVPFDRVFGFLLQLRAGTAHTRVDIEFRWKLGMRGIVLTVWYILDPTHIV